MLEICQLCGGYGRKEVLKNINAAFSHGTITSVIGRNGCGKSTLLQMCCGLLKPASGRILLDGRDISEMKHIELARKVSYMEQVHTVGNITVRSLVSHGRFPYLGYPRRLTEYDRHIVEDSMRRAGIYDFAESSVAELSGGQQQRAYIAMLLAQDADVLLLDEPSTYLDISSQLELMRIAAELKLSGKTVIMVLHDLNMALSYSDITLVMKDGGVIAALPSAEAAERGFIQEALGVSVFYDEKTGHYFFGKDEIHEKSNT